MSRKQQPRRLPKRTKETTAEQAPLGAPGHRDPKRHIETVHQFVEAGAGEFDEFYEFVDPDLGRRLTRRGWVSLGAVDGAQWEYHPSVPEEAHEQEVEIPAEDDAAYSASFKRRLEWYILAEDRGYNLETEADRAAAVEILGPEPMLAGADAEFVDPTLIVVEEDHYRVVHVGFEGDAEQELFGDRHELWNSLDRIEGFRHAGIGSRIRRFS